MVVGMENFKIDKESDIHYCRYRILECFRSQLDRLKSYLCDKKTLTIGTLGPVGTTSYFATTYFIEYIKEICSDIKIDIKLWDNFDLVYEAVLAEEVNLIVIPNAYEKITEMYWEPALKNSFSFLLETPAYGLVTKRDEKNRIIKDKIRIASCRPVVCLIDKLISGVLDSKEGYELILANSTTKAAEMVINGMAEYAVTNETSIENKELEFISETFSAEVLWSVFCKKKR
jgi:bacilysin biosynthesis protein BacA